ncbi:YihY/virulence factor BrkB family protein [Clostridium bowmanii]|uniref:YihY/virulence factor BrkB family protein n=1 Tax=Clostridium bowmanii TaxID=132925 RepID=UPI001C0E2241|nr:YihY/virulence factor BrkB family protein [Clostridium bowmanii]MBU3188782.1 YihY/virulence factor BrkB family protein [Clostridium bowmanii]MCA1073366.1 YihY/virulence factor BrkB family protein [Clostridium bowmanii]
MEQLIFRYKDDDLPSMSAQMTYYLILAFFPFLLFLINLLSFTPLSSEILITNFNKFLPNETGALVKSVVVETLQSKSETLLIVGMIGSLWAASKGISAIIKCLNKAYDIEENRNFIKLNLIAIVSTIGIIIMIILSFFMIVFGQIIGNYVFGLIGATLLFNIIWSFLRYCIPLLTMFTTFSLIYRYVPNRKLKFNTVIKGTIFTTVGWVATSLLFSFYVNNFANYQKVYGSLGGIIALISWLYVSTLIILLGGELNAINRYFQSKEKIKKYDSYKLIIPLIDKFNKNKL